MEGTTLEIINEINDTVWNGQQIVEYMTSDFAKKIKCGKNVGLMGTAFAVENKFNRMSTLKLFRSFPTSTLINLCFDTLL